MVIIVCLKEFIIVLTYLRILDILLADDEICNSNLAALTVLHITLNLIHNYFHYLMNNCFYRHVYFGVIVLAIVQVLYAC